MNHDTAPIPQPTCPRPVRHIAFRAAPISSTFEECVPGAIDPMLLTKRGIIWGWLALRAESGKLAAESGCALWSAKSPRTLENRFAHGQSLLEMASGRARAGLYRGGSASPQAWVAT